MQRTELLALAPRIRAIAAADGSTNLAAFGLVARDQTGPTSDLLDRLALKHELEDVLRCRVDLIRQRSLRLEVLAEAERGAMPLG